jgi:hypothetical protein
MTEVILWHGKRIDILSKEEFQLMLFDIKTFLLSQGISDDEIKLELSLLEVYRP